MDRQHRRHVECDI